MITSPHNAQLDHRLGAAHLVEAEYADGTLGITWTALADTASPLRFVGLTGQGSTSPLALVPAFLISELGRGLELAVMILLPFVAVDLIAAQVLVLLGLPQTPSATVALPAKILLFLAADGWQLVVVGLIEGYS